MEILETRHAMLTAYEVVKIIKRRERDARPYTDNRDQEHLGEYDRVKLARSQVLPSLLVHSPEGTSLDNSDTLGPSITQFCSDVMALCGELTLLQVWNLLSVRPRNDSELACLFPTPEEWSTISPYSDGVLDLVQQHFPITD
jgi:hypothetical protein